MKKKILCVMLMVLLATTFIGYSLAAGDTVDPLSLVSNFTNGAAVDNSDITDRTLKLGGTIITIFQLVGVGVAVMMLIVLAMKYMLAAPGDKADIKKHAVVYIVGAVILFAVSGILEIIEQFAGNLERTSNT